MMMMLNCKVEKKELCGYGDVDVVDIVGDTKLMKLKVYVLVMLVTVLIMWCHCWQYC